jgi:hypothetical protein
MEDYPITNIDKLASIEERMRRIRKELQEKGTEVEDVSLSTLASRTFLQNEKLNISGIQSNILKVMNATGLLRRKYFKAKLSLHFRDNEDPLDEKQFSIERLIHRYVERLGIGGVEEAAFYWQNKIIKFVQANRNTPVYKEIIIQPLKLVEQQWGELLSCAKTLNIHIDVGLIDRVRAKLKKTEEEAGADMPSFDLFGDNAQKIIEHAGTIKDPNERLTYIYYCRDTFYKRFMANNDDYTAYRAWNDLGPLEKACEGLALQAMALNQGLPGSDAKQAPGVATPNGAGEMALLKPNGKFIPIADFDIFGDDVQYQSPSGQGEEGILVVQNAENGVICRESKNSLDFLKKHSRPPASWMATDDNGGMGRAIGVIERWKDSGNRLRPGMVNFLKCYQFSCKKGKYIGDVNDLLKEDTPGKAAPKGPGVNKNQNRIITEGKTKQPSRKIPETSPPKKSKKQWFPSVEAIHVHLRNKHCAPHYSIVKRTRISEILATRKIAGRWINPKNRITQIWVLETAINNSKLWTTHKEPPL